ncbi:hypothetical protein [Phocaeicola sp.]
MINKLLNKIYASAATLCCVLAISSCTAGLTYEEAPESVYSEVGVSKFNVNARELFTDKIYAVNWDKWVDNYIDTRMIGSSSTFKWTNETGASYTLPDGTIVKDGETIEIEGSETIESDSSAPGGKLHVLNVFASSRVQYQTANKGYLFDGNKFSGDFELVDPVENRSQYVNLPVRKNEIIGEMYLIDYSICTVEPVDGAPKLGMPGDLSKPSRYLVKNIAHRPAGVEQYQCLYEVRVTFLP